MIRTMIIVALSVSGHVVAVYLAHLVALSEDVRRASKSAPESATDAGADGSLHHLQPLDPLPILVVKEEAVSAENTQPDRALRESPMPDAP